MKYKNVILFYVNIYYGIQFKIFVPLSMSLFHFPYPPDNVRLALKQFINFKVGIDY